MKVPLLDLNPQNMALEAELMKAIERVLHSQAFILGPEVESFEKAVAAYCKVPFAIGMSSGTDALLAALMALDVLAGDEVITSPYSFFATAGVIARLGAKPVFVDIDPETFNINTKLVERVVTSKTKVLMPVHLFGQCADMSAILSMSQAKKIAVVEDAAQAIGSEYVDGRRAGTIGDFGCYSFFPSKNLGALGDGGMVVTSNQELCEKVKAMRVHGAKKKYYHTWVGGNFRLDALQAAVLAVKLPHLDTWSKMRQSNADYYRLLFQESGLVKKNKVILPKVSDTSGKHKHAHIYNQFVIRTQKREELKIFLQKKEIGTEVYYPLPLHLQDCFSYLGYRKGDFPEAERAAEEVLALPIYPELTPDMQQSVVSAITEFYS